MLRVLEVRPLSLTIVAAALAAGGCDLARTDGANAIASDTFSDRPGERGEAVTNAGAAPPNDVLQGIVRKLMREQYGKSFDTKHACWPYSFEYQGNKRNYCMRPLPAETVLDTRGTVRAYVAAFSVADINDDVRYAYSHIDPGLLGVFMLERGAGGEFVLQASNKDLDFGSGGDCACSNATFERLGLNTYGWKFSSGGVWQGIVVTKYSLLVADQKSFKDISQIPRTRENEQAAEYRFEIDKSDMRKAMYPLLVTRNTSGSPDGAMRVEFNAAAGAYVLPEKF